MQTMDHKNIAPREVELSIATTAYNEAANLPNLLARLHECLEPLHLRYEIVVVNNGSFDNSAEVLQQLQQQYPRHLRVISLTRNFGHQGGIITGIRYSRGQAVVTMDADLQHPPEIIADMIAQWQAGYKIVNSVKNTQPRRGLRPYIDRAFYRTLDRLTGLQTGQGDFRLMDRCVVDALLALPEKEKYLRGLIAWLGFKSTSIPYTAEKRLHGRSKFSSKHLFAFAMQALTAFSTLPLRLLTRLGIILLIPSTLYILYAFGLVAYGMISHQHDFIPPGWATLVVTVIFFGAVQLLALGILGEYIGRIYLETKRRPDFVVDHIDELPGQVATHNAATSAKAGQVPHA